MNGVILVNKEANYTSRDVVNIVSKAIGTKKVGHTGTLDPIATGVLALTVGSATKLTEVLMCDDKIYEAEIMLGLLTDTLDITGNILKEENANITKDKIKNTLKNMIGTYEQVVPIYSAIKVGGRKLYEYARKGIDVTLPKHDVNIYSLELISDIKYENGKTIFKIRTHVSKGTYIRSLIRDIAENLNTIGIMTNLCRIKQGNFLLDECYLVDDIKNGNYKVISIEELLSSYYSVVMDDDLLFKVKNGQILENIYNKEYVVFLTKEEKVKALYKLASDNLLHVFKMF